MKTLVLAKFFALTSNLPGWTWSMDSAFLDSSPWPDSNPLASWARLFCFMHITPRSVWEVNGQDLEICSVSFLLFSRIAHLLSEPLPSFIFLIWLAKKPVNFFSVSALIPGLLNAKQNCAAEMGTLHYSARCPRSGRGFVCTSHHLGWAGVETKDALWEGFIPSLEEIGFCLAVVLSAIRKCWKQLEEISWRIRLNTPWHITLAVLRHRWGK